MADTSEFSEEAPLEDAGRRKPRTARTPAERLSAVQEKNRRAQKRFRERQKVRPPPRRALPVAHDGFARLNTP